MRNIGRRLGLLALLGWAVFAGAASAGEADMRGAITRQLEAMQRGDQSAAFAIASPMIQAQFQDAATFMRMVQLGFPQMLTQRTHRFLNAENSSGIQFQRVLIESESGSVVARYTMVEINGTWRIDGCVLEQAADA